jgi:Na+-translocating ferredoxin:NAD+ oxidoreductase RNF subunit RnfB
MKSLRIFLLKAYKDIINATEKLETIKIMLYSLIKIKPEEIKVELDTIIDKIKEILSEINNIPKNRN